MNPIRKLRRAADMTQDECAARVAKLQGGGSKFNQSNWSRLERMESVMDMNGRTLEAVCTVLGKTPAEMYALQEESTDV